MFLLFFMVFFFVIGQTATPPPQPGQQLPFEVAVHQTPAYVTSVYVGNLQPETTRKSNNNKKSNA